MKSLDPKKVSLYRHAPGGVWYVDFASLYPHIFSMFNLFNEVQTNFSDEKNSINVDFAHNSGVWHGNKLFQVRGYYDISEHHPLSKDIGEKLKMRFMLKKEDPTNPMIQALKIFLNSLYGAARSSIFEQIHTPNCGWDCCWLGQQIQEYTENRMSDFGFETIAGDTDSIFVIQNDPKGSHEEQEKFVKECLSTIVDEIKENVPFPAETFTIDIEQYLPYVMWPFSKEAIQLDDGTNMKDEKGRLVKELRGKKKNYVYLYHDKHMLKMKIVGLPIKKDNSTIIGPKILKESLEPIFLEKMRCKVSKREMNKIVSEYLAKPGAVADLAREFKVKPLDTYKCNKDGSPSNNIYAQISAGYFNGQAGVVKLIKNKKVGRAGKTAKYCTIEEAEQNNLSIDDLDLTKLQNELKAFVEN